MNAASDRPPPFPWDEVMATGLGAMRLSPAAFWAMTPREFACAAGLLSAGRGVAPGRADLEALMRLHPDEPRGFRR